MASYQSGLDQFNAYQAPGDLSLINQTLALAQEKYDVGEKNYQDNLAQLKVQENLLLRPEDRARFAANVQGLIDEVNSKEGGINWAKRGLTNKINSYTKKALDDYTINQIANSQQIKAFDSQMAEKAKKNDGSYSDINYAYAKYSAGVQDYLEGKRDTIGNLQYSNYIDVNKKLNDQIAELEKLNKDKTVEIPRRDENGKIIPGEIQVTTISNLSPDEVRQIAINSLSVQDQKQIQIDGWASTGGYSNPSKIQEDIKTVIDTQVTDSKEKRDYWLAEKGKASNSPEDIKRATAQYNYYDSQVSNLGKNKDILLKDPASAATYLQQHAVVNNAVAKYSTIYDQSSVYRVDEVYQNKLDNARKDAQLKLEYDKFDYEKKKDSGAIEAENLIVAPKATTHEDISSIESNIDTQISAYGTQLNSETTDYKNKIQSLLKSDPSNKEANAWMSLYNQNIKKGQNETDAVRNALQQTNGDSSILIFPDASGTPKNYRRSILDISGKYDTYTIGRAEAINKGTEEHVDATLNNKETFKAFFDNPNTTMLWYRNGKPTSASVKDVLISRGLMDRKGNKIGNLKEDSDVLKALQRSFYASDVISNATFDGFSGESVVNIKNLARSLGENPDDVLIKQSFGGTGDVLGQEVRNFALKKGTKTANFLQTAKNNGIYDTFGFEDNSLTGDDATISRFINSDYKNSTSYKDSIKNLYGKTYQNYSVGVTPSDKIAYNRLASILSSDAVTKATGKVNPDNTFNISISPSGDTVTIQQYDNDKEAGTTSFETTVDRSTFERNLPQVAKKLNFNVNQAHYTIDRVRPLDLISNKIQFFSEQTDEQTYLENINSLKNTSDKALEAFAPYLTQTDAIRTIQDRLVPALGTGSKESAVVEKAIKNSSNFSIVGNVAKDFNNNPYLTLMLKNKAGNTVYKKSIKNVTDVDSYKNIIDNSPQIYFADMINDIMESQKNYRMQNNTNSPYYDTLVKNL